MDASFWHLQGEEEKEGTGQRKMEETRRWHSPHLGIYASLDKTEVLSSEMQLQWIWRKNWYQTVNFLLQISFSVKWQSKIRTSSGYQCSILLFADANITVDTALYLNSLILFLLHFPWYFIKKLLLLFQDENSPTFTYKCI